TGYATTALKAEEAGIHILGLADLSGGGGDPGRPVAPNDQPAQGAVIPNQLRFQPQTSRARVSHVVQRSRRQIPVASIDSEGRHAGTGRVAGNVPAFPGRYQ